MNNLAELLQQWQATPRKILYRQHVGDVWRDYDAATILSSAARWQAGYRAAGLIAGDRVALCLKNGVQWVAADLAAQGLGLIVVPLYVDDNADNIAWCVQDSGAKLLIADHLRFMAALQLVLAQLPQIVLVRGAAVAPAVSMESWLPPVAPPFAITQPNADALATIVYTSGTLGRPKGVMLSHRNILDNVAAILDAYPIYENDVLLSVLPLSHMFERTGGYYLPLSAGATVAYCRGINELAQDMAEQRPTVIMAVPRLFERMLARIDERLSKSRAQRFMFYLAARAGWRSFRQKRRFYDALLLKILHPRVVAPLNVQLGGRLRQAVMGGAALDQRVAETLIGLGVPLLQGYGLTEASPVVSVNRPGNNDPVSVGEPLRGVETGLSPHGELLVRGSMVMQGYWNNPTATQKVIDAQGWLNTGDIVEIRERRIYIRGRSKNILVLSNGEKIAPEDIESAVMQDEIFEQVLAVGEARPYLILLAVAKSSDEQELLRRANQCIKHLPRYAKIRRVIATEAWSKDNGLLTPTLKIKRNAVYERYRPQIEAAYRKQ
ncbi:MAG TPA: AMP-dependent synthetase/ligase [Methylophilaceae bacterium]|nr:AMP-dependent synthetase/ligase [Methylophilaceae bacterium]